VYCHASKKLLSAGDDSMLVCWAMDVKRLPVIAQLICCCYDMSVKFTINGDLWLHLGCALS